MPPLNEGTILYMPTTVPGLSIPEATKVLQVQDQLLTTFPEVERVFGKMGKAPTATDQPSSEWPRSRSRSSRNRSGGQA
ncbi:MAG: hypothetical protein U0361_21915 [Nitrospiraceae bacterium]